MYSAIIDAHVHVDLYDVDKRSMILQDMETYGVEALIAVSNHFQSAKTTLKLSEECRSIKPAFGFHPEQDLPTGNEIGQLQQFIEEHCKEMIAIGEVGLPYYTRQENPGIALEPYIEVLECFITQSKALNKPIVLHAVYEDAPLVCSLLEKHSIKAAHFHWFKGDQKTMERMIRNGYFISITPDILYEKEIQQLVRNYPLTQMMVETDGPWPFVGPFTNEMTHPKMIHQTIGKIASIKDMNMMEVYDIVYKNTKLFYRI